MTDGPWYYLGGSGQVGPLAGEAVRGLLAAGSIGPGTPVWTPGLPNWMPLAQTALATGIHPAFGGVPPRFPVPAPAYGAPGFPPFPAGPPRAPDFGEAISLCFWKYVVWAGRATRSEFWFFYLFCVLISLGCSVLDIGLFGLGSGMTPLASLASLVLFLPQLSVTVRRLHDTDRSAWWVLMPLLAIAAAVLLVVGLIAAGAPARAYLLLILPGVASLWPIVFMFQRGTPGPNRYG